MSSRKKRSTKSRGSKGATEESPEDYSKFGGFILVVLGAIFGYSLVNSPWDFINTIPKLIGIIFCLFIVFGGILLLLPEQDRPAATQALVTGFTLTLKAIVSLGREMARQVSIWRERRKLNQEKQSGEKEEG